MPKAGKSTRAEYTHRVNLIAELMVQGIRSRRRIILYVRSHDQKASDPRSSERERWGEPWNVSDDQLYNYIKDATAMFQMSERANFDHERALIIDQLENIITGALQHHKFTSAVSAIREKMYLFGFGQANVNIPGMDAMINALKEADKKLDAVEETVEPQSGNGHNGNRHE